MNKFISSFPLFVLILNTKESLLARLILKSVKEALELGKFLDADINNVKEDPHIESGGSESKPDDIRDDNPSGTSSSALTTSTNGYNNKEDELEQNYITSFQFSVLQYEKGR